MYCMCTSGTVSGNYLTATGDDVCGWTTMPTDTWTGSSCIGSTTAPTTTQQSGEFIFTQTLLPVTGDGSNWDIIGCTSTYVTPIQGHLATYCVDSTPISTQVVTPTLTTPTGQSQISPPLSHGQAPLSVAKVPTKIIERTDRETAYRGKVMVGILTLTRTPAKILTPRNNA